METAFKEKLHQSIFSRFIPVKCTISLLKKLCERYATDVKNEHDYLTTANEMRVFIAIFLLTGYHSNVCERDYWSDAEDLGISLVKNATSCNQFQKLKSYLHFVDNRTISQHAQDRSIELKHFPTILSNLL
ncbi:zinc finger protein [Trichonephila clavipes]|nr:zinc finger protein [Trichonephila clavipes]